MEKLIDIQLPDGTITQKSVIYCQGDCKDPAHIRVHLDPNPKPKMTKKEREAQQAKQLTLDLK